jgi:phenylpropionate dioxygenase-like ring-hydroxylating dioxygenase large terminal subunit
MRLEKQREIVRALFDLADRDTTQLADATLTVPVSDYLSSEVYDAERERLFRTRPVVACLSCDLREPGDYYATESGGVPFVVVRHPDHSLRAYVNICRHRGSPLVPQGPGHIARTLRCGFHGWVYDVDGTVISRPHATGGFDSLDDRCYALIPVPVAEAHGIVFVRPVGADAIDLDDLLCGMGEELEEFGFAGYHRFEHWESEWSGNWKLLADTFLETYHVPTLHPDTVARNFIVRPSACAAFGPNIRFHSLMKSLLSLRGRPETEWELLRHGTVEYFLLPNTVMNYSVDHLAVYRFLPLAPDHTRVLLTLYTPHEVSEESESTHYRRTLDLHQRVSGGQDFTKQEEIQRAISSGALPHVVFGRNEPAAIHFHQALRTLLVG